MKIKSLSKHEEDGMAGLYSFIAMFLTKISETKTVIFDSEQGNYGSKEACFFVWFMLQTNNKSESGCIHN